MTAFVLDASVTAAWLLPDEANAQTRRLYALMRRDEFEPQAPNLWQWECTNIIANGGDPLLLGLHVGPPLGGAVRGRRRAVAELGRQARFGVGFDSQLAGSEGVHEAPWR